MRNRCFYRCLIILKDIILKRIKICFEDPLQSPEFQQIEIHYKKAMNKLLIINNQLDRNSN